MGLEGRSTLVTGAASGIGAVVATRLSAEGAKVIAGDLNLEGATRLAGEIGGIAVELDVSDEASWDAAIAEAVSATDRFDALVNCAGIDVDGDNIEECTLEKWQKLMEVNLDGVFLGTRAAVRAFRAQEHGGSIVNISSVLGVVADGETLAYSASKAAVRALTKSVALDVAAEGIRCNAILPGFIQTPMTERWLAQDDDQAKSTRELERLHPVGRLGRPEEVAAAAAYLIGDEAAFVTGAALAVDGGYLAV